MDPPRLVEGRDYYVEDGLYVFTAHYLKARGYCCRSGCRHCPYGFLPASADRDPSPNDEGGDDPPR
jgi:hypothetical protein